MNTAQIEFLKQVAAQANEAYTTEQARLVEAGFKSKERYEMLKPLKAEADRTHTEYYNYANKQIKGELNKMIAADRPAREAGARARSAWKMAKYQAAHA